MKKTLNLYGIFLIILLGVNCSSTQKATSNAQVDLWSLFNYDIECEQVGKQGSQSLIVSSIAKNQDIGLANARKHAVHAIMFKGVKSGPCNVPALVSREDYDLNRTYFMNLFNSYEFERFIISASDTPRDVFYVGRDVKVFSVVNVNRNDLRAQLVKDGVIRGLNNVF
jgi:hypothetical protein